MIKFRQLWLFLLLFLASSSGFGQTSTSTTPIRFGGTLPATCDVLLRSKVLFYKTGTSKGLYYCSATNTWTALASSGGTPGGGDTQLQYNNAGAFGGISAATWDGTNLSFTNPKIVTGLRDTNGNSLLGFTATASAVNNFNFTNSATGNDPILSVTGGDADRNLQIAPKGIGKVIIRSLTGATPTLDFYNTYGGFTAMSLTGSTISAAGGLDLGLTTNGSTLNFSDTNSARHVVFTSNVLDVKFNQFVQQNAGNKRITANVTNTTTTMSNLTDLSTTLVAGKTYSFRMVLFVSESTAADGIKVDFDGGTATATDFRSHGTIFSSSALVLSTGVSAIATDFTVATLTGDSLVEIYGTITVNGAGTFIPRAAQNGHTTGTLTVYRGGHIFVTDVN